MNPWRGAGFALTGVLVLILILYRDAMLYLAGLWSRFEGSPVDHGYLVLGISLFIIWQQREQVLSLEPCPSPAALPVIAACILAWLVASLADVLAGQLLVLIPLVLAGIWAVAGWQVMRQLLFPVAFMAFALPLWAPLLPVLRVLTAAASFFLVRLSGITAHLTDYVVQLPSGQLHIESACSGLNYLLAALTLGVFYAWLNYRDYRSRLLVVVIAIAATLLANILRVFIIIYLAYVTDMQHPLVHNHRMFGWYLFGAMVLVLLFADHLISRRRSEPADAAVRYDGTVGSSGCKYGGARRYFLLAAVAGLIAAGPVTVWWLQARAAATPELALTLPSGQGGWSGPVITDADWQPVYHGASEILRSYSRGDTKVLVYAGFYARQRQDSELINDLNTPGNNELWPQAGAEHRFTGPDGQEMLEVELRSAGARRRLVWYRYQVAGRYTTSRLAAKVLQVAGLLAGRQDAAVYALAVDLDRGINAARHELSDFHASMWPVLAQVVGGKQNGQESGR